VFLKLFGKKKETDQVVIQVTGLVDGIDLEMNYCPACGIEYRQDIKSCVSCAVDLISGEEKLGLMRKVASVYSGRSMDIGGDDELVSLRKGPLRDIKVLQKLLAKERIPSVIAGDESSCGKGCCGPEMFLQIKTADTEAATAVLAMDFVATTAVDLKDLEQADVVFDQQAAETACPACGSSFSPSAGACPECGLCFE
jgi:hypothetical protein